ncbi:ABC-type transporter Mla maintaining outer membrane lipid asymmetry, periplasmic component MlaD [endosymbiont of Ridgeia piscesae]|jgi:phospholipid/cholesterol/gamma-HCH transport system substrate-binding protein|uniref:ABC-type transporter Mla maintaining outer membrane lipid asymmetry, periplasmic component MlaD n=2 Tax=endosymbiont of Ridgeia piscesae TaxID=54398 RepID=A0A0T5YUJ0_9GAMM|nr:MlaD family protein [endosymbiont of Ridgeia piscesae]KRT54223.1 ABC-type transporter Mla maintaining outer membrane lipid asymmetry, periplasmic component MlaD [endosymbiont of Ridgeia piscesae]
MTPAPQHQQIHYVHRLNYTLRERLAGLFVMVALALLIGLVVVQGKTTHLFENRITYHTYLRNAQGIATDSLVKVSGIEVGRVQSIGIAADNRIHISFFVYEGFQNLIRQDSRGALSKLAIIGTAVIEISAGSPQLPMLRDGSTILIEEPMSADELLNELTPIMEKVRQTLDGIARVVSAIDPAQIAATAEGINTTVANLRDLTNQVNSGKGVLGRAIYDQRLERSFTRTVTHMEQTMAQTRDRVSELKPVLESMVALSRETQNMTHQMDGLIADSRQLVGQMNSSMQTINMEIQQLPDLVTHLQLMLQSTDRTLEGLQRVWPVSSAIRPTEEEKMIDVHPIID